LFYSFILSFFHLFFHLFIYLFIYLFISLCTHSCLSHAVDVSTGSHTDVKLLNDLEASLYHILKYPTGISLLRYFYCFCVSCPGWLLDYSSAFNSFLAPDSSSQKREQEMLQIRSLAIPNVFFLLFEVLTAS